MKLKMKVFAVIFCFAIVIWAPNTLARASSDDVDCEVKIDLSDKKQKSANTSVESDAQYNECYSWGPRPGRQFLDQCTEIYGLEVYTGLLPGQKTETMFGVKVHYRNHIISHGSTSGKRNAFFLQSGEKIVRIVGRKGQFLDQVGFYVKDKNGKEVFHGPYGGYGGSSFASDTINLRAFCGNTDRGYLYALGYVRDDAC